MNPKTDHLTWRQILDLLEGRDTPETWTGHLEACVVCTQQMDDARVLANGLRFVSATQPADDLVERVVSRLEHYGPELTGAVEWAQEEAGRLSESRSVRPDPAAVPGASWVSRLRAAADSWISAALVVDSWRDRAVAVRGSSTASPRILVYETQDHTVTISLHLGPDPQEFELDLIGQMAPRRGTSLPEGILARLGTDQGEEIEAQVQPFGEFRFDGLRSRPLGLVIELGNDRIELGPFPELGAS